MIQLNGQGKQVGRYEFSEYGRNYLRQWNRNQLDAFPAPDEDRKYRRTFCGKKTVRCNDLADHWRMSGRDADICTGWADIFCLQIIILSPQQLLLYRNEQRGIYVVSVYGLQNIQKREKNTEALAFSGNPAAYGYYYESGQSDRLWDRVPDHPGQYLSAWVSGHIYVSFYVFLFLLWYIHCKACS